jgi:hypothetical protein
VEAAFFLLIQGFVVVASHNATERFNETNYIGEPVVFDLWARTVSADL